MTVDLLGDPVVTVQHLHLAGLCANKARVWAADHGFVWGDLVRDGVRASVLEATGCALALRVVAVARAECAADAASDPHSEG